MTFKTRRIVFYSLFFIFIVTGLGTIFYSQGWRINIEKCQIAKFWNCQIEFQKTGAIFIETKPKDVLIKIDGKTFKDKSGLIQSGTLITNLLPETYKVTIEKEGYLPWQKDLKVEPTLVAEILKTVLIPKKLEEKTISIPKTVDNFWINSQQKIIFKNNEIFYYLEKSSPFKLRGDKFIEWSSDGNKVILLDSKTQTYYLYEFNNLLKVLNINVVFNNLQKDTIDEIFFHPNQSDKLIIKSKNSLYLLDLARLKLEIFLEEPIIAWAINNPNIYYIKEIQNLTPAPQNVGTSTKNVLGTKKYFLASFNLVLKTESLISQLPNNLISSELKEELEISISGDKIAILSSAGSLYIFNQKDNTFKQIAHSAKKFIFSPDRKKIAFLDKDGKLNIYFLEDYQMGINKKAGEVISFLNYPEKKSSIIKDIFWYQDSHHLLIEYFDNGNQGIDFIEIDNRLPINKYTLIEKAANFYYELGSNQLYFIKENNLCFIEI